MSANVIVQVKECDVCRMAIRIFSDDDDREIAFDVASGDEHECFEIPEGAEVLVMEDNDDCDCGH